MSSFLIENVWRIIATLAFVWTILNLYIVVRVDPDGAPKWTVLSLVAWICCWVLSFIAAVIGAIWTY